MTYTKTPLFAMARDAGLPHRKTIIAIFAGLLLLCALGLLACHDHDHDHKGHKAHGAHKGHKEEKGHKGHKDHKDHDEHKGEVKLSAKALKQVKLQIVAVKLASSSAQQVAAVGRISLPPQAMSRVGSRVSGRIVRLFVKIGQQVRRGQSLVLLDSPTVGLTRAKFLRALALLRVASVEYKRTKRLKKIGVASSRRLLAARVARERAEIDLRSARAQLDVLGVSPPSSKSKKRRLTGRFVIRAPFAGEITALPHSLGAWVSPKDPIMRVEQRKKVWALLEIYAQDLPFVKVGYPVHLYGPGIHSHLEGRIDYLASRFERGAQTLEARVALPNPKSKLRPGQFVYGLIERHHREGHKGHNDHKGHDDHKDGDKGHKDHKGHEDHKGHDHKADKAPTPLRAPVKKSKRVRKGATKVVKDEPVLVIPEGAVQRLGQGQVVFVPGKEKGHFQVRTVVTIEAPQGNVRVLYGLKAGDRVVVRGSFILKSELMRASLESEHGHAH